MSERIQITDDTGYALGDTKNVKEDRERGAVPIMRRCHECDAVLRTRQVDLRCDPCQRALRSATGLPDPDFYYRDDLRDALAAFDFGPVLRALRHHGFHGHRITQLELGHALDLHQAKISAIENGSRRLNDVAELARIVDRLGIPPHLLGFGREPATAGQDHAEVAPVDRRSLLTGISGLLAGLAIPGEPFPPSATPGEQFPSPDLSDAARRVLQDNDVRALTTVTHGLRTLAYQFGGGRYRGAALALLAQAQQHLRDATGPLLEDLRMAIADLAGTAAWLHYDDELHGTARGLWQTALQLARAADHPRSADLTVTLLLNTAHQALHLGHPQDALSLVQHGAGQAAGHRYPVSTSTHGQVAMHLAWCHASLGDRGPTHHDATHRALDQALQTYTDLDPANADPWAAHVGPAEINAQHGHALHLLAATDPTVADEAAEHLRIAVDGYGDQYIRSATINLPGLSANQFRLDDIESAVRTGHRAVDAIATLATPRIHQRLRRLVEVIDRHTDTPDVVDLRHRITTLLATTAA